MEIATGSAAIVAVVVAVFNVVGVVDLNKATGSAALVVIAVGVVVVAVEVVVVVAARVVD